MSLLPDHLLGPALKRWLPQLLEPATTPAWWAPPEHPPPRRLRRLVTSLSPLDAVDACDALVVLTPLLPELPSALTREEGPPLRTGVQMIELGTLVPGPALLRLRPWRRRQAAAAQAADRFARWLEVGLLGTEQWVSIDPDDTVVTLGRLQSVP